MNIVYTLLFTASSEFFTGLVKNLLERLLTNWQGNGHTDVLRDSL